MAKVQTTVNAAYTTDAGFRTWGSAVSAAISSAGLTQTSDTGQINWTTVTKPTAANTLAGYEIWRFNDSLQSTSPVFIRLEYRSGNNTSGNNPQLYIIVGSATNGSGTITGLTTGTAYPIGIGAAGTATTAADNTAELLYSCYSSGSFFLVLNGFTAAQASTWTPGVFSVSRTVDTTGAYTGDGVYVWAHTYISTNQGAYNGYINYTASGTQALTASANPAATPVLGLTSYDGSNKTYVLPHYCDPVHINPGLVAGILTTRTTGSTYGGFPMFTVFSCKPAGPSSATSHTYIVLSDGSGVSPTLFNMAWPNTEQGATPANVTINTGAWRGVAFVWE